MAVETRNPATASGEHAVQFYEHDAELFGAVGACHLHWSVGASFPVAPDSPARARRLVAAALRRWGHGERLVDDVTLMVSELATNAVRHARSRFSVAVRADGSMLRIAVQDAAPLDTTLPHGGLIPRPVHGLGLINTLSASWGVERTHDGKIVWAEIPFSVSAR